MPIPDRSLSREPRAYIAPLADPSVAARVARLQTDVVTRIADTAWAGLHAIGAHRWRDGWETDAERGWSRYRGTRCTVCDVPWEGW
jgi:hypothetical protein